MSIGLGDDDVAPYLLHTITNKFPLFVLYGHQGSYGPENNEGLIHLGY